MTEKEFEEYWRVNRNKLLNQNASFKASKDSYKMTTGADWLLYAIPVVAGIVFMDCCSIQHELLRWFACAGITIACFVLCVFIKTLISGDQSMDDIEKQMKKHLHDKMVEPEEN